MDSTVQVVHLLLLGFGLLLGFWAGRIDERGRAAYRRRVATATRYAREGVK